MASPSPQMPHKGHIYNKVYGRDAYRLQTYTKNPIRPVPITSHTPTLIFFKKRHFDRNYSVHHCGLPLSKTGNNDTCYIEANTIGSTRCKRYYYPIDIKLLYLRPQIPDLRPLPFDLPSKQKVTFNTLIILILFGCYQEKNYICNIIITY